MDSMRWLLQATVLVAIGLLLHRACQKCSKRPAWRTHQSQRINEKDTTPPDWQTLDLSSIEPIKDFDWKNVPQIPYRPWSGGPHHVTMGLKQTSLSDWVEIDNNYLSRYTYKRKLFAEQREQVLQHLPGSEASAHEALQTLADLLPRRYPSLFLKTDSGLDNLVTGDVWDLRPESTVWRSYHPLEVLSLLTSEDWIIMKTDDDGLTTRLVAGASCFPAGWKIQERIGHSVWQIHGGKVPHYEQKLATSMDRFFLRLRVDSPIMRFNYAIDNDPELFHIHSHHNLKVDDLKQPLTLDQLFLRVERQFLQRLPKTRAVVFSIRTYVTPLAEVTKDDTVARGLRTSVNSYSADVAMYKNKPLWDKVLADHLDQLLGPDRI